MVGNFKVLLTNCDSVLVHHFCYLWKYVIFADLFTGESAVWIALYSLSIIQL